MGLRCLPESLDGVCLVRYNTRCSCSIFIYYVWMAGYRRKKMTSCCDVVMLVDSLRYQISNVIIWPLLSPFWVDSSVVTPKRESFGAEPFLACNDRLLSMPPAALWLDFRKAGGKVF